MPVRVLALDPIHADGLAMLRARQDVDLVHLPDPTPDAITAEMERAHILLLRGRRLPWSDFARAEHLRLVSRHGVGCDNLDLDALRERGIGVAVSADANLVSVAEHAFALMLAAAKNLLVADTAVRTGDWARRGAMSARDFAGSHVLVVGGGRIGRAVAQRALAFAAAVAIFDPVALADLPEGIVRADDLDVALGEADIVSIHVPLTPETTGLFDGARLARLKPGAILVNTARGGIVDEDALGAALDARRPALYATDVLAQEPPPRDNPLLARDDVILSPHSAAMSGEGVRRMATSSAQNALDYIDGRLAEAVTVLAPRDLAQTCSTSEGQQP